MSTTKGTKRPERSKGSEGQVLAATNGILASLTDAPEVGQRWATKGALRIEGGKPVCPNCGPVEAAGLIYQAKVWTMRRVLGLDETGMLSISSDVRVEWDTEDSPGVLYCPGCEMDIPVSNAAIRWE